MVAFAKSNKSMAVFFLSGDFSKIHHSRRIRFTPFSHPCHTVNSKLSILIGLLKSIRRSESIMD